MANQHFTRVLSVDDAKIARLLTEPGAGVGAATYSASVDAIGIQEVSWVPTYKSLELRGDNSVLDTDVIPGVVTGKLKWAKISVDMLAVLWGGTVGDSGSTPNQVTQFTLTGGQLPLYFRLEVQCKTTDFFTQPGDVHFVLYKCKIVTGPEMMMTDSDYGVQELTFKAVQPRSTDPWARITFNETAATVA